MAPRPLPEEARQLCNKLAAPALLVAHLTLVHDVACDLVGAIEANFAGLAFDRDAVLFGASTHDLGKVLHPSELSGPGHRHEEDGPALLEGHGVPPALARFAGTHAAWRREADLAIEDLLVSLADSMWKGQRNEELETRVESLISKGTGIEGWAVFATLDDIVGGAAMGAEARLAWQATFRG
jgi:hypothetical protein